jgi:ABC-type transporter Mla MlaB component
VRPGRRVHDARLPTAARRLKGGHARTRAGRCLVDWDVKDLRADAATVDALARLQLAARRQGARIGLYGATAELRELIGFMGLQEVLPIEAAPRDRGG